MLGLSRDRLPNNRADAAAFYIRFLTAAADAGAERLREAKRWLCRNDLFYLLVGVCKRKDIDHPWLFDRCREICNQPNGYIDLWAREHYKSTIITFGLSLQDILASHGEDPEPRFEGREATIGIFSFNRPAAKAFLRQIKYEVETNTDLRELFPDVLFANPQKESPKWSEDEGLVVRRRTNPKEATVEAYGVVDGMPVGKHYLIRVYDDLVTKESVTTPEMILKVTTAWELSDNLGTEGGVYRVIGTRYALHDTYRTMMDRGIPDRTKPCTWDGSEDWSKSVLRSPEFLTAKRRLQGPYTFGAQMLLNPTADKAQGFKREWLRYWKATHFNNLNRIIIVDPASKKKKTSDYTTMWVIGLGGDKNYYVLDCVRDRLNLVERQRNLFNLHRQWRPLLVGYEEYGLQADIEHYNYVMEQENYRFSITPLGGQVAKEDRIKSLVPVFEQGRVFFPDTGILKLNYEKVLQNLVRVFIDEEYEAFPVVQHDDMLDPLARLVDPGWSLPWPEPTDAMDDKPRWMREIEAGGLDMAEDDVASL
jgi:predicted phage terminase large subunit-like protein